MPAKLIEPKTSVCIRIDETLMDRVRFRLMDINTKRTAFGAISRLFDTLLREWLEEQEKTDGTIYRK